MYSHIPGDPSSDEMTRCRWLTVIKRGGSRARESQPLRGAARPDTMSNMATIKRLLGLARDRMGSDWSEGHGPLDPAERHEAAHLISEARQLIGQAKDALQASGERVA